MSKTFRAFVLSFFTLSVSIIFICYSLYLYISVRGLEKEIKSIVVLISSVEKIDEELQSNVFFLTETNHSIKQKETVTNLLNQIELLVSDSKNSFYKDDLSVAFDEYYKKSSELKIIKMKFNNIIDEKGRSYQKSQLVGVMSELSVMDRELVKKMRICLGDISQELESDWSKLFITIIGASLIAIVASVLAFYLTIEIAKRTKIKKELEKKDRALELVFKQIPAIIWTTNRDSLFTSARGDELIEKGIDAARLVNKVTFKKIMRGHPLEELNIKAHEDALIGQSIRYEHFLGDTFYDILVQPLYEKGEIIGTIGMALNITARKNAGKLLEEKNNELDAFVYKASHDMRGAIATIQSAASLINMESKATEKELLEYTDVILNRTNYLSGLLSDMFELTRVTKHDLDFEEIDLVQLIENTFNAFPKEYLENAVYKIENNYKDKFYSDTKILKTVIINLLGNAFKYRKSKDLEHNVEIKISGNKDLLSITISDTGIGIPEKHQQHIFEMFYRANDTTNGSGLGLFIVKNAIDKLGGRLSVNSVVDRGTDFTIVLPNKNVSSLSVVEV